MVHRNNQGLPREAFTLEANRFVCNLQRPKNGTHAHPTNHSARKNRRRIMRAGKARRHQRLITRPKRIGEDQRAGAAATDYYWGP